MLNVLNVFNWYLLFLLKTEPVVVKPELNTLIEKSYEPVKKVKRDTYNLLRTSFTVLEKKFNPTRYLSYRNKKVTDMYDVPNVCAIQREAADAMNIELGDFVEFILPNGKVIKKQFADYMSSANKYYELNRHRVDFLVNKDEKLVSHPVKLVVERN